MKEWVQHGLGLPQYAEAFRENMITAADFPLLVDEECKIFENELQVHQCNQHACHLVV